MLHLARSTNSSISLCPNRHGKFWLVGLRDPLAADPLQLLRQTELDPHAVDSHWEPYHSFHPGFVLARARTILDPPATVTLHLDHHTLSATGAAPHSWIVEARRAVRALPAIERFQTDQLVDMTRRELTSVQQHIEQSMLFFVKGNAQPLPDQESTLAEVAAAMQRILEVALAVGQQARIDVIGQADKTGSEDKNRQLSRERADYVFSSLVLSGVPPSVLSAVGIGSHGVVDDARVKEERVLHRRVSFKVHMTVHANQEDTAP
jgi:outer membrane protein OmpA-like peptidoglycan-associated protein